MKSKNFRPTTHAHTHAQAQAQYNNNILDILPRLLSVPNFEKWPRRLLELIVIYHDPEFVVIRFCYAGYYKKPIKMRIGPAPCSDEALQKCFSSLCGFHYYRIMDVVPPYHHIQPTVNAVKGKVILLVGIGTVVIYPNFRNKFVGMTFWFDVNNDSKDSNNDDIDPTSAHELVTVHQSGALYFRTYNNKGYWRPKVDEQVLSSRISPCGLTAFLAKNT